MRVAQISIVLAMASGAVLYPAMLVYALVAHYVFGVPAWW
jgi:hypothetical protein